MRGRKTPPVAFITRLINTTSRPELRQLLNDAPLKRAEISLILDYADGMTYKELAQKNNKSIQRINQMKRKSYEKLARYLAIKET